MSLFQKIVTIDNQVEALCLAEELQEHGIPHNMRSYYDTAYDGLFQYSAGWGHVEAAVEHKDTILTLLQAIRRRASGHEEQADEEDVGETE